MGVSAVPHGVLSLGPSATYLHLASWETREGHLAETCLRVRAGMRGR